MEAGWAPEPVWTGAENLAPAGIRSPDRLARSKSLYRLSYPHIVRVTQLKLYLSTRWKRVVNSTLRPLCPLEKKHYNHWIGSWMGSRANPDVAVDRKTSWPFFFFFFFRRYDFISLNVLAFSTYNFHLLRSWMQLVQSFIFSFFM